MYIEKLQYNFYFIIHSNHYPLFTLTNMKTIYPNMKPCKALLVAIFRRWVSRCVNIFWIMITGDMERLRTKYYIAQNQKRILCKFLHLILLLIANALLYLQKLGLFARILCLWWIKGQNLLKEKWFAKLSQIDSIEIHFLYFFF